jgi:putative oxidoreductase
MTEEQKANVSLAALRLIMAVVFVAHGAQKLFGWFGGGGINGTAQFMAGLGLNPGVPWTYVSGIGELAGGLLLLFGVLTPVAALILTVDMVFALIFRTSKLGFISGGGMELNLLIIMICLGLGLLGPGRYRLMAGQPSKRGETPIEPAAR